MEKFFPGKVKGPARRGAAWLLLATFAAAVVLRIAWDPVASAWAASEDRASAQAPGCINNPLPGGADVCVSPQPEPPPPTMSPTPDPTPSPTESAAPPPPPPPPPGPSPSGTPTATPSPSPSKSPSPTPSPTPTETPPAVDPVFPVPTPDGTTTVDPPKLEPLGSGLSLFSPEGALLASAVMLGLLIAGGAMFGFFRHMRLRKKQISFDTRIYQAVQEMKEKTLLLGRPGEWGSHRPV